MTTLLDTLIYGTGSSIVVQMKLAAEVKIKGERRKEEGSPDSYPDAEHKRPKGGA